MDFLEGWSYFGYFSDSLYYKEATDHSAAVQSACG